MKTTLIEIEQNDIHRSNILTAKELKELGLDFTNIIRKFSGLLMICDLTYFQYQNKTITEESYFQIEFFDLRNDVMWEFEGEFKYLRKSLLRELAERKNEMWKEWIDAKKPGQINYDDLLKEIHTRENRYDEIQIEDEVKKVEDEREAKQLEARKKEGDT